MKHTEGEWQTSKMSGGDVEIWAPGTPKIATVHLKHTSVNEHKANVLLIASAPEMLKCLKQFVEDYSWAEDERNKNKEFDNFWKAKEIIKNLENEIPLP